MKKGFIAFYLFYALASQLTYASTDQRPAFESWLRNRFKWTGPKQEIYSPDCKITLEKASNGNVGLWVEQNGDRASYFMQPWSRVYLEMDKLNLKLIGFDQVCESAGCDENLVRTDEMSIGPYRLSLIKRSVYSDRIESSFNCSIR